MPTEPGEFYHVYIKYTDKKVIDTYPDENNYDYMFTLPNNKSSSSAPEIKYSAFIGSNETKGNGTYYIGVKLISTTF